PDLTNIEPDSHGGRRDYVFLAPTSTRLPHPLSRAIKLHRPASTFGDTNQNRAGRPTSAKLSSAFSFSRAAICCTVLPPSPSYSYTLRRRTAERVGQPPSTLGEGRIGGFLRDL
ncbi:hypothetical protein BCR35DRAFT_303690, partial [Leucosporidium creatinivorum]